MERLKVLLKLAFAKSAHALKFKVNEHPRLVTILGSEVLGQEPRVDSEFVAKVFEAFFPMDKERLAQGLPASGQLSVVEKGTLHLIAEPGPAPAISFYFAPGGAKLFTEEWAAISGQTSHNASQERRARPGDVPEVSQGQIPKIPNSPAGMPRLTDKNPVAPPAPAPIRVNFGQAPLPGDFYSPPNTANIGPSPFAALPTLSAVSQTMPPDQNLFRIEPEPAFLPQSSKNEPQGAPRGDQTEPLFSEFQLNLSEKNTNSYQRRAPDQNIGPTDHNLSAFVPAIPAKAETSAFEISPPIGPLVDIAASRAQSQNPDNSELSPVGELQDIHFGAIIPGTGIEPQKDMPINELLRDMIKRKASDLHLTMGELVCFRIDGEIIRHDSLKMSESLMKSLVLPIMPRINKAEFLRVNDTDFSYEIKDLARFRVNVFRDRVGVGAVLRQIPSIVLTADQLGLPKAVRNLCQLHKGLVIVTGPTGSGKTTTMASMVDIVNSTRQDHILTIEDPIEFVHTQKQCLINQREVHRHTESFSRALRAALREDPDVVMIGEMRDLETVGIAIETAETGHLVFGTLHTNTAISTVDRIIDQFPTGEQAQVRVMLAESLKGVVAQTLCKKKGGGRVAALEILIVNNAVSSLIREGKIFMISNIMQTQKSEGNMSLNESLAALVMSGVVEAKDAWFRAADKDGFTKLLQTKGITIDAGDLKASA